MAINTKFIGGGAIVARFDTKPTRLHLRQVTAIVERYQRAYRNAFGLFSNFHQIVFRFTQGKPKAYKSSPWAEFGPCENCGSTLTMMYIKPLIHNTRRLEQIVISFGTLDHPENIEPIVHGYVDSQLPWLKIEDGLPRVLTT